MFKYTVGFFSLLQFCFCCNNYRLITHSLTHCDNSILRVRNVTVTLDKDCNIVPRGCMTLTKPFRTGQAHLTLKKPPMMDIKKEADVCKAIAEKPDEGFIKFLASIGVKCPMSAKTICLKGRQKISLEKYRNQMRMAAGRTNVLFEVDHNTGKACLKGDFEIKK